MFIKRAINQSSSFFTANSYVVNGLDVVPVGSIPTNYY